MARLVVPDSHHRFSVGVRVLRVTSDPCRRPPSQQFSQVILLAGAGAASLPKAPALDVGAKALAGDTTYVRYLRASWKIPQCLTMSCNLRSRGLYSPWKDHAVSANISGQRLCRSGDACVPCCNLMVHLSDADVGQGTCTFSCRFHRTDLDISRPANLEGCGCLGPLKFLLVHRSGDVDCLRPLSDRAVRSAGVWNGLPKDEAALAPVGGQ